MAIKLTYGERLQLARRRENLTIPYAAAILGLSRGEYLAHESRSDSRPNRLAKKIYFGKVKLAKLSTSEHCFLLRRRCGLSQEALAHKVGVSRPYLNLMERGKQNPARLAHYWNAA